MCVLPMKLAVAEPAPFKYQRVTAFLAVQPKFRNFAGSGEVAKGHER